MWHDSSDDQSRIVRVEVEEHSSSVTINYFLRKIGHWIYLFWEALTGMLTTTRPVMMMLGSSSVVDHHRGSALTTTPLDQMEDFRIQDNKTRSCLEISSVGSCMSGPGEEPSKSTGLVGTSFPPLIPLTHFNSNGNSVTHRCGLQDALHNLHHSLKHHSESDLTDIGIMSQSSGAEEGSHQSFEEELPYRVPSEHPEEETLFPMDEDEPLQETFSIADSCNLISDSDVSKFLSGLQDEKTFDKTSSWDNEEAEDSDDDSSSSSSASGSSSSKSSSPIRVKCNKFESSLSTIEASPVVSSLMMEGPSIEILGAEENLTLLQKKILESHPPTKPSNQPERKFLEVKDIKGRKLRRASSLKIYTSPEEKTETQKKIVRFADVLGLDLENTKTYNHGIPTVPKSAYLYLKDVELSDTESETSSRGIGGYSSFGASRTTRSVTPPYTGFTRSPEQIVAKSGLAPQFTQPGAKDDFSSIVESQNLCLECAYVSVNGSTVSGIVAVKNISFHKNVCIRYTLDDWQSFSDGEATYSSSCPVSGFDKFSFDITFPSPISLSQRLQLCIRYSTVQGEFWDNNFGANYVFKSLNKFDKMSSSISHQSSRSKRPVILSQSPSCTEDPWLQFV